MSLRTIVFWSALALNVAVSHAGTVYVAPVIGGTVGGVVYETELVVSNPTDQELGFTILEIEAGADGTVRSDSSSSPRISVAPGRTLVLDGLSSNGVVSMLEVTGDDALVFGARLDPRPTSHGRLGARVPVVSSHDVLAGGTKYHIQGWERTDASQTAFGAINLSHEHNRCRFVLVRSNGTAIAAPVELTLPPLSSLFIGDALNVVGIISTTDTRLEVECDGASYAYGLARSGLTGELRLLVPSRTGASTLQPPTPIGDCPPGSACFSLPAFTPSPGNEIVVHELADLVPGTVFDRVRVELTFRHGGWDVVTDGLHGLFWLYRNDTWRENTFGYVNLRGPARNLLVHLTNVGLPPPADPVRSTTGVGLEAGRTYHAEFVYDGPARLMRTRLRDSSGALLAELVDRTPTNRVSVEDGFEIQLGLRRELVEVPTYGWRYSDVRVTFE